MGSAERLGAAVVIVATVLADTAAAADPPDCPQAETAIPAQPLFDAFICLSKRTGTPFHAEPGALETLRSRPVDARGSVEQAVAEIAAGLPIDARVEEGVIIVRRRAAVVERRAPPPPETPPDAIVVRGFRAAYGDAIAEKRDARRFVDVIKGEQVGLFPDQNLAEAIQRIAGTSITRVDGEGESVSVRGLDPTFTRVEIDGRTTAVTIRESTPERATALSIFASDLYDTITVVKSPTAADVEGGVGGIVRLRTPDPRTIGERRWDVSANLTRAELRDALEPSVFGAYADVLGGGAVGVLVSGTYERLDRRLDRIQSNEGWSRVAPANVADAADPAQAALLGARFPERMRQERRAGEGVRANVNAKIDVQPSDDVTLTFNGLFAVFDRDERISRAQVDWARGLSVGGSRDPATGALTQAAYAGVRTDYRQFWRDERIESIGLSAAAAWTSGPWRLDADIARTSSTENRTEHRVDGRVEADPAAGYSLARDPAAPQIALASATIDPALLPVGGLQFQRRVISLRETHAAFDAARQVRLGPVGGVKAGARIAASRFARRQGALDGDVTGLTYADGAPGFALEGPFGGGDADGALDRWPSIDPRPLVEARTAGMAFAFDDEDVWTIEEDVLAGYGLIEFAAARVSGDAGVRVTHTDYAGQGRVDLDTAEAEVLIDDAPVIETDYTTVLPAFNLVVALDEDAGVLARAAVSRGITRPTLNEIRPNEDIDLVDGVIRRGAPDLEPFLAWQYDVGLEVYFGEDREGLLAATLYVKDVENFIVPVQTQEERAFPDLGAPPQTFIVDTFRNGGEASVFGVELNLQAPFDFAPGFVSDFGVFANYTFTDSELSDGGGRGGGFPGASRHSYNVVGYYERGGLSARLAYNYRDAFLIFPATDEDGANAVFGDDQGRLDFAARYRFGNGVRVSLDALNLTKQQSYIYYDDPSRLENREFEGRVVSLGIGYSF